MRMQGVGFPLNESSACGTSRFWEEGEGEGGRERQRERERDRERKREKERERERERERGRESYTELERERGRERLATCSIPPNILRQITKRDTPSRLVAKIECTHSHNPEP